MGAGDWGNHYGQRSWFEWNKSLPINPYTGDFDWLSDILTGYGVYDYVDSKINEIVWRAKANIVSHDTRKRSKAQTNRAKLQDSIKSQTIQFGGVFGDRAVASAWVNSPYAVKIEYGSGMNRHFWKRAIAAVT